jgi:hypothetical protein
MKEFKTLIDNTSSDFILLIKSQLKKEEGIEFVQDIILLLFKAIRQTTNIDEADLIFNNLDNIQYVLAEAVFGDKITVTHFLREFIYDFDRIDDTEHKRNLYRKIKTNAS